MAQKNKIKILIASVAGDSIAHFTSQTHKYIRLHPDTSFEINTASWAVGMWQQLIKSIRTGAGPDIFLVGNNWVKQLERFDAFCDMRNVLPVEEEKLYFASAVDECRSVKGDRLLAVPLLLDSRIFFCRRTGATAAWLDSGEIMDENTFEKICMDSQAKYPGSFAYCRDAPNLGLQSAMPWIWNHGGDVMTQDGKIEVLLSDETFEGLRAYFSLLNRFGNPYEATMGGPFFSDFFKHKRSVLTNSLSWPLQTYMDPKHSLYFNGIGEQFGIINQPSGPAGQWSFLGGSCLVLMKYSKEREASESFLRFMISNSEQLAYCMNVKALPCHVDAFDKVAKGYHINKKVFRASYENGRYFPHHYLWSFMEPVLIRSIGSFLNAVVAGEYSERALREELRSAVEKISFLSRL